MKTPVHASAPLLAFALLAGCGEDNAARIARAEQNLAIGENSAAALDAGEALRRDPGNVRAIALLARARLADGDGEGAARLLGDLRDKGALPTDFAVMLGEAELKRGRPEAAIAAVSEEPSAEGWRIRAAAAQALEQPDEAALAYAQGANAAGPRVHLLSDAARFALLRGETAKARALVDSALAQAEVAPDALNASAQVAGAEGKVEMALAAYARALELHPGNREALLGKIGVLGELNRIDDLRPLVAEAEKRRPNDPTVIFLKAKLAGVDGDWKQARRLLLPLESRLSTMPLAGEVYAEALLRTGLVQQARANLVVLLRADPQNRQLRKLLAEAQTKAGDPEAARKTLALLNQS